jgi:hypothetical protein
VYNDHEHHKAIPREQDHGLPIETCIRQMS